MAKLLINSESSEIQWRDSNHFLFLNPKWPSAEFDFLVRSCEIFLASMTSKFKSHSGFLILASSGTSRSNLNPNLKLKLIAKENFLSAAASFNSFFSIASDDIFLRALPLFHVGGLALHARSFLSGARVIEQATLSWNPQNFLKDLVEQRVTRASLVPTQIFDLVKLDLRAPENLKTVFVGGAPLSVNLRNQALDLDWPLLASYGLTEMSSMVASQKPSQVREKNLPNVFYPLPGVNIRTGTQKEVFLQGPGLFTAEIQLNSTSEAAEVWAVGDEFETEDRGNWNGQQLEFLGRSNELIKISGELVSLQKLRMIWDDVLQKQNSSRPLEGVLLSCEEPRIENEIVLVTPELSSEIQMAMESFNQKVLPFERIRRTVTNSIPRTELGKVQFEKLRQKIHSKDLK